MTGQKPVEVDLWLSEFSAGKVATDSGGGQGREFDPQDQISPLNGEEWLSPVKPSVQIVC